MAERRLDEQHVVALGVTADALGAVAFILPFPDRSSRNRQRTDLADSIRDSLLPRLADPDAPVVAVVMGLTGTGKSTIVNTLGRRLIAPTGVTRPTTKNTIVWAHRRHAGRYWSDFVTMVKERLDPAVDLVVTDDPVVSNLTVIDAPPLDLAEGDGAAAAAGLLAVADLCVFVASATRYADSAAWDLLRVVERQGLPVLHVLNRLPADRVVAQQIAADYASRLAEEGLLVRSDPAMLFTAFEQHVDQARQALPGQALAGLRYELSELANPAFRDRLYDSTTGAMFEHLAVRCRVVAELAAAEAVASDRLGAAVAEWYGEQTEVMMGRVDDGDYAYLAEDWDEAEFVHAVVRRAGNAAQDTATAWSEDDVGKRLLDGDGKALWRHGPAAQEAAEAAVDAWQQLLRDVAVAGSKRRRLRPRKRRKLASALRGQVLRGTSAKVGEQLASAFGEEGSAVLIKGARQGLAKAVHEVLAADRTRFEELIGDRNLSSRLGDFLREQASQFEIAAKEYRE